MSHSHHSIPCYIANGGVHNVINVPMGIYVRLRLKALSRRLLTSLEHFGTFMAIQPEEADVRLLRGLDRILSLNLKPKAERSDALHLLSAHEKNLKPRPRTDGRDELCNLVSFSISCGLIVFLFILAAHLSFLESMNY